MSNLRQIVKKITPQNLKTVYRGIRKAVISSEFVLFRLFPIKKNRVVLCNVWGYGDNPKWVTEALVNPEIQKKENIKSKPDIIFITDTNRNQQIPNGIKVCRNNTLRAVYMLATASVWLDCNRKEPYIKKRKGQYYIQTWHGSLPLKKIERDCADEFTEDYSKNATRDTAMTDLYISNSEFCDRLYRRAFGYQGKIFRCGSPRVDILLKSRAIRQQGENLKVTEEKGFEQSSSFLSWYDSTRKKITDKELLVIYAPTFRGDGERPKSDEKGDLLVEALEKRFGKSVCVIKRLHPLCLTKAGAGGGLEFSEDNAVDGSTFGDLYELMSVADVLITDYSNTMFEFAYSGKPVFLYAPDSTEYAGSRGMYFEYEELPFPIGKSVSSLAEKILTYREEEWKQKQMDFFGKFQLIEAGNAAEKVARVILRKLNK